MPKSHDYENESTRGSAEINHPPKLPPKIHFKTSNQGLEVFKRQCSGGASNSNDSDTVYASSSCGGSSNLTPISIQKENSNVSVSSDRLNSNHSDFRANPELIRVNSDRRANKPLVSPTARHLQLKLRRCESAEDDILSEKEFHGRHFLETLTLDKNDTNQSPSSILNQISNQNSNQNSNSNSNQNSNQNLNQHSVPNLTSYQNPISNPGFISNQNSNSSQSSYQTPTHSSLNQHSSSNTNSQQSPQNTSTCSLSTTTNDTTQPLFLNIPRPPSRALSEIGTQATSMGTSTGYQSPSRPGSVYSYSGGTTCPNSGGSRCASPNLGSMPPSPLATGRASNTFVHRPVPLLPNPLLQTNQNPLLNNPLISQSPVCSDSEHQSSPSLNPAIINFAENHRRNLSTSSSLDCEQIENRISENRALENKAQNTESNEENCQQKIILNVQNSQIQNMFNSSHPTSHNQHNYLNNQYSLSNPLLSESDETAHVTILTAPVQTRRDSSSECLGAATPQKKYITKREFQRERKTPSPCLKPPSLLLTSSLSVLQNNNLLNNPFLIGQKRPRPCSESSNFESGSFNKKMKDDKDEKIDSCSFTSPGCGSLASCTDRMDTKMETTKFLSNSSDKPPSNFDKMPAAKKINLHTPQFQQTQNREQRLSAWVDSSRQFEGTPPSVPHALPSPNSISSSSPVNLQRFAISTNSRDAHVASTTPANVFPSPSSPFSLRSKSPTPSECSIGSSDLEVQRYTYKNANLPEPNKQLFRGYKQVKK